MQLITPSKDEYLSMSIMMKLIPRWYLLCRILVWEFKKQIRNLFSGCFSQIRINNPVKWQSVQMLIIPVQVYLSQNKLYKLIMANLILYLNINKVLPSSLPSTSKLQIGWSYKSEKNLKSQHRNMERNPLKG